MNRQEITAITSLEESVSDYKQSFLIVASSSPTLTIIQASKLQELQIPHEYDGGHSSSILTVYVCPQVKTLVTGGKDTCAVVWKWKDSVLDLVPVYKFSTESTINFIGLSSNGNLVCTISHENMMKTWPVDTESKTTPSSNYTQQPHLAQINGVDFIDNYIATCSQDKTIKIWDFEKGINVSLLTGHQKGVLSATFARYSNASRPILVSTSSDLSCKVWEEGTSGWMCMQTFQEHSMNVMCFSFMYSLLESAGKMANLGFSVDSNGVLKVWEVRKKDGVTAIQTVNVSFDQENKRRGGVWCLKAFSDIDSPIGLTVGSIDGNIDIWTDDTKQGVEAKALAIKEQIQAENVLCDCLKGIESIDKITIDKSQFKNYYEGIQKALFTSNYKSLDKILKSLINRSTGGNNELLKQFCKYILLNQFPMDVEIELIGHGGRLCLSFKNLNQVMAIMGILKDRIKSLLRIPAVAEEIMTIRKTLKEIILPRVKEEAIEIGGIGLLGVE